jgi:DNA-binding NtrC family response regulator
MFGHERGAFTGAAAPRHGLFATADGGTIFLDEIGEMPLPLQAKLLRVLERKVITRVGGTTEVATDARLIAATHRDLEAEVRAGRFRQDLMFRIGGFTLVVPPLRDRAAEIVPLAELFARTTAAEQGRPPPVFAEDAKEELTAYTWPGNVRELKNLIERLVLLGTKERIEASDLPRPFAAAGAPAPAAGADELQTLEMLERSYILRVVERVGNKSEAARVLGISRQTLRRKMGA